MEVESSSKCVSMLAGNRSINRRNSGRKQDDFVIKVCLIWLCVYIISSVRLLRHARCTLLLESRPPRASPMRIAQRHAAAMQDRDGGSSTRMRRKHRGGLKAS